MNGRLVFNMPAHEYHSHPALSCSILESFRRTPAHARYEMLHPKAPTEAMEFGTAMHKAILEPDAFADAYAVAPKCDRRTKEGKATWVAFQAENKAKEIISDDDMAAIQAMQAAVAECQTLNGLLRSPGKNEVSCFWKDAETGLDCRLRLDALRKYVGWTIVLDLKTCESAGPGEWEFPKSVMKYGYHRRAAFYLDALNTISPGHRRYFFGAIESEPPYCCAVYELAPEWLDAGRAQYREAMRRFAKCLETNIWPGYPDELEVLEAPKWLRNSVVTEIGE